MDLQPLRTTGDSVLIHIPERLENTITVAGRELWFDSSWHELESKNLMGVLVAVPETVGESYLLTRKGSAGGRVNVNAIQEVLAVGDVVVADWTVSEDHGKVKLADFEMPGVGGVYRASLNQLVARVREEQTETGPVQVLEPYGSYVLCQHVWPDDVQEVEVPGFVGKMHLRVSASGLTMGSEDVPPLPWQGVVTHVGLPLRGQPQRVRVGDRVVFDKAMCGKDCRPMKLKLAGVEYLCIRQDYIAAVLEEVPTPEPEVISFTVEGTERYVTKERIQQQWGFEEQLRKRLRPGPAQGYNYDPEIIAQACRECGVEPDIERVVRQHQLGLMRSEVMARVLVLGGITSNAATGYPVEDGHLEVNGRAIPLLVTDCCRAEYYNVGHGTQAQDRCRACGLVAHLVPQNEFSTTKPAA